jgi:hypothetical protein
MCCTLIPNIISKSDNIFILPYTPFQSKEIVS